MSSHHEHDEPFLDKESASAADELPLPRLQSDAPARRRGYWTRSRIALCAAIFVVLAVALGAGLGAGLKKKSGDKRSANGDAAASTATAGATSAANVVPLQNAFLRGQNAMASEPATTRYYDFVLEQRNGAPDGFRKSMLVVNGEPSSYFRTPRLDSRRDAPRQACTLVRLSKRMSRTASSSM